MCALLAERAAMCAGARGHAALEQRLARMKELGLVSRETPLTPRSRIPHPTAANRHGSMTEDGLNPPWESLPAERRADLARRMATYAAMVSRMDTCIGRLISDLRDARELDNTLVFFLSDNGACAEWEPFGFDLTPPDPAKTIPGAGVNLGTQAGPNILHQGEALAAMGGPGTFMSYGSAWANACNTPWRLYKHYGHEGGISTSCIVHWPAGIAGKGELRAHQHWDAALRPRRGLITFVKDRPGHDLRYAIDSRKIERDLGWAPRVTFEAGLRQTLRAQLSRQRCAIGLGGPASEILNKEAHKAVTLF